VISENRELTDVLAKVITTPIVASACPNIFVRFIETLLSILYSINEDFKVDFVLKIVPYLRIQL
jgi:hypothetical protein